MPKAQPANQAERMERAEEYMEAAREHYLALTDLPPVPPHMPLAYYLAGLAIECLFRAYEELVSAEHDAGHDLRRHAVQSRFFDMMVPDSRDSYSSDLSDVYKRWLNNHRYRSSASLRRYLTDSDLFRISGSRTVKGDVVIYNWNILLAAATRLLHGGTEQWKRSKVRWNKS